MIKNMTLNPGIIVKFGTGTVRIHGYSLKSRYGGQIELTRCVAKRVGDSVTKDEVFEGTPKVVLDFKNVESLDVFIEKLKELREDMSETINEVSI